MKNYKAFFVLFISAEVTKLRVNKYKALYQQ